MIAAAFLAALSQVLLKKSANRRRNTFIEEFINPWVLSGYALLGLTMGLNILAYQHLSYKIGPILTSSSYVFVTLFSRMIFGERLGAKKLLGAALIVAGIVISHGY